MGLPKIQQPLFEVTIPSSGLKTTFRPFTVKEEKILLMAQESGEIEQIILSIKQILNNCIPDVDPESYATFDLEYLILKIRGQSINNQLDFTVKDPDTEETVELSVDINTIQMTKHENHSKEIPLGDYTLVMRYPRIEELQKLAQLDGDKSSTDAMFDIMMGCIDSLVEGEDTVYKLSDFSKEEVTEFLDGLTSQTVNQIREFFTTQPSLRVECPYTNSEGKAKTFVMEGLQSFFI